MTVWLASPPAPRSGLIDRIFSAWQGNLPPTPPSEGALTELATRLTLLEAGQAKADAERAALIETNARLEERLAATAERFAQERKTTTRQSEIIIQLQSTITSLQETSAGHTAEFLSFSDTIGALKEQNRDQHNRMLVMRETIDNLRNKIAAMGEQLKELPSLRHRVQELLLSNEVWRRYAEELRHQMGESAPPLPVIPAIPAIGEDVGR